jgi:monoterpene epsilon-lactone hydrolase
MIALSLPEALVAWFLRTVVKPVLAPRFSVTFQRRWLNGTSALSLPPMGVRRSRVTLGGIPTIVFTPKDVALDGAPDRPVVLYLHGGAFVLGGARTHQALAGYLAREIGGPVHLVDYRLAPEHPYPAGRDDALAAYRGLLDLGVDPGRIVVAGDSAGGVMATDLGLDLAAGKGPVPAGLVLLSAAFALDAERPAGVGADDTLVSAGWAHQATTAYARPGGVEHAILGCDLSGLPPVHLQYSEQEMLAGDSRQFVDELRAAGAAPEVRLDDGAFHVIALLPGTMKRSRTAVEAAADFVGRATARRAELPPGIRDAS